MAPLEPTPERPTPERPTPERPTPERPTPERPTPVRRRARLVRNYLVAIALALAALAALVVGRTEGSIHGPRLETKLVAWIAAGVLLVSGSLATRLLAHLLGELGARTPTATASVATGLRIVGSIIGYLLVALLTLWLLDVSVEHLLLGGALTGVILAVAAQQSLGNLFAGVVLLLARPFAVGDAIRIRSGTLGGPYEGTVRGISLTYVRLDTADGPVMIPNGLVLGAAVARLADTNAVPDDGA